MCTDLEDFKDEIGVQRTRRHPIKLDSDCEMNVVSDGGGCVDGSGVGSNGGGTVVDDGSEHGDVNLNDSGAGDTTTQRKATAQTERKYKKYDTQTH